MDTEDLIIHQTGNGHALKNFVNSLIDGLGISNVLIESYSALLGKSMQAVRVYVLHTSSEKVAFFLVF